MSIDIFENLEHITLDEYAKAGSEDAERENYTGIILDPEKIHSKTCKKFF